MSARGQLTGEGERRSEYVSAPAPTRPESLILCDRIVASAFGHDCPVDALRCILFDACTVCLSLWLIIEPREGFSEPTQVTFNQLWDVATIASLTSPLDARIILFPFLYCV